MWEQYLPTTPTDIVLVVILVLSALFALFRGFVREFLAILAWVGAFFVTIYSFGFTYKFFHSFIDNEMVAHGLSAALLFLISLIIFSLIAHTIASWIHKTPLSSLDRFLGLIFGLLRGMLLICLLYIVVVWFYKDKDLPVWVTQAKTLPLVQKGANYLADLVPEEQRIKLIKMFQEFISDKSDKEEENFIKDSVSSSANSVGKAPIIKHRSEQHPQHNNVIHPYTKPENITPSHDKATPTNDTTRRPLDDPIHVESKPAPVTPNSSETQQGYDQHTRDQMDQLVKKTQE